MRNNVVKASVKQIPVVAKAEATIEGIAANFLESRQAKVKKRRQKLLDSALITIKEKGPFVSMDEIALGANIRRTVLYRYFGDRSGLYKAISEEFMNRLVDQLVFDTTSISRAEINEVVNQVLKKFFDLVEENEYLFQFVFNEANLKNLAWSLSSVVGALGSRLTNALVDVFSALNRDTSAAEPLAYGMIGMAYFTAQWWLKRKIVSKDRIVMYLTEFVTQGINIKLDS